MIVKKKNFKVKDYCHYTGKYRGAAHDICNLRYKIPKEIPVVFHNGSTCDYHFIIKELAEEFMSRYQARYQVLLIIYLKEFMVISAKIVNLALTLCQSKMIN